MWNLTFCSSPPWQTYEDLPTEADIPFPELNAAAIAIELGWKRIALPSWPHCRLLFRDTYQKAKRKFRWRLGEAKLLFTSLGDAKLLAWKKLCWTNSNSKVWLITENPTSFHHFIWNNSRQLMIKPVSSICHHHACAHLTANSVHWRLQIANLIRPRKRDWGLTHIPYKQILPNKDSFHLSSSSLWRKAYKYMQSIFPHVTVKSIVLNLEKKSWGWQRDKVLRHLSAGSKWSRGLQ